MKPFKFLPNRVLRLYHGGAGIDRLCGCENAVDCQFPENWIASCIEGNGRAYHSPGHGISRLVYNGVEYRFPEFLHKHAEELLGKNHLAAFGENPAVLVKFLDSAEQLPMQVHPTKADARKFLCSDYGKTEAWLVLETRRVNGEEPYLLAGFNQSLDKARFIRESIAGKYETGLGMLNRLLVTPGDVIVIPGGLPHAIGPGVTMVEVMEPSDWVVVPEIDCCGVKLDETQRFIGLPPKTAVSFFHFRPESAAETLSRCSPVRQVEAQNRNGTLRTLISPADCPCFSVQELMLDGSWDYSSDGFRIGAVVAGTVEFDGLAMRAGDSFFVPDSCRECRVRGAGRLFLIRPPEAKKCKIENKEQYHV